MYQQGTLSLKVTVPGDQVKALRFSLTIPIAQVIEEIKEKIAFHGREDHGLFQPEIVGKSKARWLNPTYTLQFYQLAADTSVVFQKVHRPLRVELLDKSIKTVMINDSAKVKDIRDEIGKKIGLANSEEYGLRVRGGKEGVWLNVGLGLYEQDVNPTMILVFDKNYYFTDDQIDRSDPQQLHLIYIKAVNSILVGQYPVTLPEAVMLAGTQAQAVYGNHNPSKHGAGFLKLAEMIPAQWLNHKKYKTKQIEAMVFSEWKKIPNTSDVNSKFKYVAAVRKLPTYGITFYTVKIPNPNAKRDAKNPLIQLLVGVTREKILRMNYETKQIEREYLLIHLKRWAAVRGKFTFDFGDHEDTYWTVFTDQGEAMSELIAGYIDIIINSRKAAQRGAKDDGSGDIAQVEDYSGTAVGSYSMANYNNPQRAGQAIQAQADIQPTSAGVVMYDDPGSLSPQPTPQTMSIETLEDAARMAANLREEAMKPKVARASERRISSVSPTQLIEALVTYEKQLDGDVEIFLNALASPSNDLANQSGLKLVEKATVFSTAAEQAARMTEHGSLMANPVVGVIGAIRDLIDTGRAFKRQTMDAASLQAAKKAYDDAMILLQSAQDGNFNDKAAVSLVNGILRDIAAHVDDLLAHAQPAVASHPNAEDQRVMNNYIKQINGSNQALQTSASTLSQAMVDDRAKQHVIDSAGFLKNLCEGLHRASNGTGHYLPLIEDKCENVTLAINRLMVALDAGDSARFDNDAAAQLEVVKLHNPILQNPASGQKQLLDGLKTVATAANEIVKQSLAIAPALPGSKGQLLEQQALETKDLLANGLTNVGKQAIRAPANPQFRQQLDGASKETEQKCADLVEMILDTTTESAMRMAAKQFLGAEFALQAAVHEGSAQGQALMKHHEETRELRVQLGNMLESVAEATKNQDREHQDLLLQAFKVLVPNANRQIAALARIPMMGVKPETQSTIAATKTEASAALQAMMQAAQRYEAADSVKANISEAMKGLEANQNQIDAAIFTAQSGFLSPTDNQSFEVSLENLKGFAENMQEQLNGLSKVVNQGGDISSGAKSIADSATDLISLGETLAGNLDPDAQLKFLEALKALNANANAFIDACKNARVQKNNPDANIAMETQKKEAQKALCDVLSAARGVNTDEIQALVDAIRNEQYNLQPVPKAGLDYASGLKALSARGKAIQLAGHQLVETAERAPQRLLQQAKMVDATAKQLVLAANAAAGSTTDPQMRQHLIDACAQVLEDAAALTEAVNAAVVTGDWNPVQDAINQLGASCANLQHATSGSAFPEIDAAIASITEAQGYLNDPSIPGQGTREVLQNIENALAALGDNCDRLVTAAAVGTDKTGLYAEEVANAVNQILYTAASSSGQIQGGPAVTASIFSPAVQEYLNACSEIIAEPGIPNKAGPAAMKIGKLTKDFAATAREDAIALGNEKERQKNFIAASKLMSGGLPKLIAAIKSNNPQLTRQCAEELHDAAIAMENARTGSGDNCADSEVPPNIANALKMVADTAANTTKALLQASSDLASDPQNGLLAEKLNEANQNAANAMAKISDLTRSLDPTMQAVKKTTAVLSSAITDLELAAVNLEVGVGLMNVAKTKVDCQNDLIELLQQLAPELKDFSSQGNPNDLSASADHLCLQIPQLVESAKGLASYSGANAKRLLQQAKNLALAMQKLANECHLGGPNTDRYNAEATAAVGEMLGGLKASEDLFAELHALVQKVKSLADILEQPATATGKNFPKMKEEINEHIRTVISSGVGLKTCDLNSVATILVQAKALARTVPPLMPLCRDAAATTDPATKEKIKSSANALVFSITDVMLQAKEVAMEDDLANRADFDEKWNNFTQSASKLIANLQKGAVGESKINAGTQAITNTINKLNSSAIFVSAGQELEVVETSLPAPQLINKLLQESGQLQQAATFVQQCAPKTQEELGTQVEKFSQALVAACTTTLQIVERQADPETQQNMINAAKAAAISAKQFILAAKDVQAHPGDSTAKSTLQNAANLFPRALQTFTSVVKGEGAANTSALDSVKAGILQAMNSQQVNSPVNPLQLVESARNITKSATPLVLGQSQSELLKGGEDALSSIQELIANVNGVSVPGIKGALQQNGKQICQNLANLVDASKGNRLDPATHDKISAASLSLTKSLEDMVSNVNKLPGGAGLSLFGTMKEQPTTTGALDEAAEAIKKALASLPIRQAQTKDLSLITNPSQLNDVLVVHARAIAEATYHLIENASQAERETASDGGKLPKERYHNDATWSNGLISSSHKVADCVSLMIDAANAALAGNLEEEKLIANAKQVAVATKQLVVASNVRGITPVLQIEMGNSAKNVAKGTSDIVATAQRAGEFKTQAQAQGKKRFGGPAAGGIAARLEQQAQILRLEKQLEEARKGMGRLNENEYSK